MELLFFEVPYAVASFSAAITPFDNCKLSNHPLLRIIEINLYLPVERIPRQCSLLNASNLEVSSFRPVISGFTCLTG